MASGGYRYQGNNNGNFNQSQFNNSASYRGGARGYGYHGRGQNQCRRGRGSFQGNKNSYHNNSSSTNWSNTQSGPKNNNQWTNSNWFPPPSPYPTRQHSKVQQWEQSNSRPWSDRLGPTLNLNKLLMGKQIFQANLWPKTSTALAGSNFEFVGFSNGPRHGSNIEFAGFSNNNANDLTYAMDQVNLNGMK